MLASELAPHSLSVQRRVRLTVMQWTCRYTPSSSSSSSLALDEQEEEGKSM